MVDGYIGHTVQRAGGVLQRTLGGVLFVDEAYSLSVYRPAPTARPSCVQEPAGRPFLITRVDYPPQQPKGPQAGS